MTFDVRHRIDGLETSHFFDTCSTSVRHRIDGLEILADKV